MRNVGSAAWPYPRAHNLDGELRIYVLASRKRTGTGVGNSVNARRVKTDFVIFPLFAERAGTLRNL